MSDSNFMHIIPPVATYVGVDPGNTSGSICVLKEYNDGKLGAFIAPLSKHTDRDTLMILQEASMDTPRGKIKAVLESVHAFPREGVASAFKFGRSYGELKMALIASDIPFREVTPMTWIKFYGMKKGKEESKPQWKMRLRQMAEQLFPDVKLTNQTADSILIANYCKMTI